MSVIENDTPNDTSFIAALGASLAQAQSVNEASAPYLVLPEGYSRVDVEDTLLQPVRKRGCTALRDAASFIRVVEAQRTPATVLYGVITPVPTFLAIFDDHGAEPGWREHRASYGCPLSTEWTTWTNANKRNMSQADFAQFIEDNAPDCVQPAAADMIEIARTLEAKKKVTFASSVRLQSGQAELRYEEAIDGTAAKGKLPLPEVFKIGVPVLEGGARYEVEARLRFRIGEKGTLTMWYDLVRPHKVIEHAVREVWKQIEEATGLAILHGLA